MGQRPYGTGALLRAGGSLVGGLDGRAPLEKQSLPSPSPPSLLSIFPEGRRIRSIHQFANHDQLSSFFVSQAAEKRGSRE